MKRMKKSILKTGFIYFLIAGFLAVGCAETDQDSISKEEDDVKVAVELTEIDAISEGINVILESVYVSFEKRNELFKDGDTKYNDYLPECVTITKTITATYQEVEVDFGSEGCAMPSGDVLKGKINIKFTFNMATQSVEITYTFDEFYYNGKKIEGTLNKVRLRMNEEGNPESTHTKDLKITWEDGTYAEIAGERTREWISGFGNDQWVDNVFSITGEWTIKRRNGKVYSALITEPLIRKLSCRFIVQGKISIERNGVEMLLDYGDGTCDNIATLTVGGVMRDIELGSRNQAE